MKLSQFKAILAEQTALHFVQPDGQAVPEHFHITEVGAVRKHFIDCGGTVRDESFVSFQLWSAHDVEHRLLPAKLLGIIGLSERKLGLGDDEILVEFQNDTIGVYGLAFVDGRFELVSKYTDCLALDQCGIPEKAAATSSGCCAPASTECAPVNTACAPKSGCC